MGGKGGSGSSSAWEASQGFLDTLKCKIAVAVLGVNESGEMGLLLRGDRAVRGALVPVGLGGVAPAPRALGEEGGQRGPRGPFLGVAADSDPQISELEPLRAPP